jgi:ABC-type enterobactin transport system permease subunit
MKRCRRLLGVIAVLFATQLLLATNVLASTHVSGWIFSNTTWTTSGSPYILDGNTGVWSGVTLAIDPGVVVEFNAGQFGTFYVDGTLTASGTSSNHVTITSS